MAHDFPETLVLMHFGLVLALTCAQMLIVYFLSAAANPPRGLGLYTVYFMAALMGWIAFSLQGIANTPLGLDVSAVAVIINSYILVLAAGQRARVNRGRLVLGALCVAACLGVFFVMPRHMFLLQTGSVMVFWAVTGALCSWRSWRQHNVGDAVIACAALTMLIGQSVAVVELATGGELPQAQIVSFATHSIAYALVIVGFLASVLIEYQQQLATLATKDPLTQMLNRRGLGEALQISLATASRHALETAAIVVDIDHFKRVNDHFGHELGDRVLQKVAEALARLCRASDVLARVGGEEFMLVLPNTNLEAARVLAERIRVAIGEYPLQIEQQQVAITISLGVSTTLGGADLETLLQNADRAMSLAKRGGRDRVASVEHRPVHLRSTGTA